jgi:pimeloyl-ACP methyl ester carboxylesterase
VAEAEGAAARMDGERHQRGEPGAAMGRLAPLRPARRSRREGPGPRHRLRRRRRSPAPAGEELAGLIPGAKFHLLEGMGHGSWYGHAHEEINQVIEGIVRESC